MKVIDGIVPPATKEMLSDPTFMPCLGTPFGTFKGLVYHRERPMTEILATCFEIEDILKRYKSGEQ